MAADPNGDRDFWSKVQKQELPHCGLCDPFTRQVERADGRFERCSRCHPLQDALLPQTWRCPECHALIYRDQRGLPCDKHRTIIGWRHSYDAALAPAEPLLPNPVTEAGANDARSRLATRPRPAPRNDRSDLEHGGPLLNLADDSLAVLSGLHGEALARAQAAKARAARARELRPVDDDEPDEDQAD